VADQLVLASTTPAKQRKENVSTVVDAICDHAYQHGLGPDDLRQLVALVARKNLLDQTSLTNLINNLYPADRVPSAVLFTIVGSLGQGATKPSAATQSRLLKWLIATNDAVEDASALSRSYSVLFNLLDMISLRTPLCHLLSLLTQRKHVRPFRIQQLLELVRVTGPDPALIGLLQVYKDYYPDIIIGSTASARTSLPIQAQDEWRQRMHAIQEAHAVRVAQDLPQQNGFKVVRQGAKRTKVSVLPEVRTSRAHETSVTLEEVHSADDLANLLDKIELPNQLVSSLKDPLLQKYLILHPSDAALRRIESWLQSYFRDILDIVKTGSSPPAHLTEILNGLLSYTKSCKVHFPVAIFSFNRFELATNPSRFLYQLHASSLRHTCQSGMARAIATPS
ncbi:inner centromere protein-like protein mis6, partial [Saccharata proteae CBS 121410]